MNKLRNWIGLVCLIVSVQVVAQKPIFVTAKMNNALIYLNGAELSHTTTVNLLKGTNEVIIKNIANQLDDNSIRISSNKNIAILSAAFSKQYYKDYEVDPNSLASKKVKDSIDLMDKKISVTQNKLDAEKEAIKMIDKNQVVSGGNTGLNVTELAKALDYYRQKRLDFANNVYDLEKEQKKNKEILNRLKNQLTVSESQEEKISDGKIVLQIMSEIAQTVQLDVSYLTSLASWQPFYEIASAGLTSKIHLVSKAKVYQTSGIDWKGIHLTLSSSQPTPNNSIPELSRWFLNLEQPYVYTAKKVDRAYEAAEGAGTAYKMASPTTQERTQMSVQQYTNTTEQVLSMNYEISLPYDIYSNGKAHTVTFAEQDIQASYSYYSIPKINADAYLVAYITNYDQFNLLAGEAIISFEGTYVGKTYLDPTSTKDTLEIAMGIDKNVIVKREKVAEKSGKKVMSGNQESNFNYEISVRNNKKSPINITIKDQYPMSKDKEVTVELTDKSGGKVDEESAFISWNLDIPTQTTKTLKLGYKVKFPKNKTIYNLN